MSLFGAKFIFLDSVDSTNNYAATLLEQLDTVNGTVVLAEYQTKGKGQRNNVWQAKKGENLTFSIIWIPDNLSVSDLACLNWWISLTLTRLLKSYGINAVIKWPNDILVNERKIAGILIENRLQGERIKSLIIGIGLNVNQIFLESEKGISMKMIKNKDFDLNHILVDFCYLLNTEINTWKDYKKLKSDYENSLFGNQKEITYSLNNSTHSGRVKGVNTQGQLLILDQDQMKTFNAGEITLLY